MPDRMDLADITYTARLRGFLDALQFVPSFMMLKQGARAVFGFTRDNRERGF